MTNVTATYRSGRLELHQPLALSEGQEVKIVVLSDQQIDQSEQWDSDSAYQVSMELGSFDFWKAPEEDIYSIEDGEPYAAR